MNNTIIKVLVATIFFYLFNSPFIIKQLKIKIDNKHLILYSAIYMLIIYISNRIIDKSVSNNLLEHQSNEDNIFNSFKKNIEHKHKKDKEKIEATMKNESVDDVDYCKHLEDDIVTTLENPNSGIKDTIKKMIENPVKYGICSESERKDPKKCKLLDMTKYALKEAVPDCSLVLPEQYNLFKPRKGYKKGKETGIHGIANSLLSSDTLINGGNYIIFYAGFVIILIIYIIIIILNSIFRNQ
jgi:hypothetical protein